MEVTEKLFGKVMKTQRDALHLTHKQIADGTDVSIRIVANMEKGNTRSTEDNENRIIAFLFLTNDEYYKSCKTENERITAKIKINYPHYSEISGTENE